MLEMGQSCAPWRALRTGVLPEITSEMKEPLPLLDAGCVEDAPTVDGSQVLTMIPKVES